VTRVAAGNDRSWWRVPDAVGATPSGIRIRAADRRTSPACASFLKENHMAFLLWILAVILVVAGIVQLFKRNILWGVALIIIGFLVGPGGYSIFK
jgi:hypothetical protein